MDFIDWTLVILGVAFVLSALLSIYELTRAEDDPEENVTNVKTYIFTLERKSTGSMFHEIRDTYSPEMASHMLDLAYEGQGFVVTGCTSKNSHTMQELFPDLEPESDIVFNNAHEWCELRRKPKE